jgi:coproporphyrinogen III oxidase-like Fe-S oxidoreductase
MKRRYQMEKDDLSLFNQMSKTASGRDFLYEKFYEMIGEGIRGRFSRLRIATEGDFLKMAPSGDYCVYIHYPYCESICKGCLYPKSVNQESMDSYCNSLIAEMDIIKDLPWAKNARLGSVFFGGGTPSLISEENIERIISKLKEVFIKDSSPQITIEANPGSTNGQKVDLWKRLGINRISIGAQSFDQRVLKDYRRGHDVDQALHAIGEVASRGMVFNLDMLYGSRFQTRSSFKAEVQRAIDLSAPHITMYPYFFGLPDRNKLSRQLKMYEAASDLLLNHGYDHYAVFEFARTEEAICQNVIDAFFEPSKDVVALGAGPSGENRKLGSYSKYRKVKTYQTCVEKRIPPFFIHREDEGTPKVNILGLGGLYGLKIDRQECQSVYGEDPYSRYRSTFDILAAMGHVQITEDQIIVKRPFRQGILFTSVFFSDMKIPKDPTIEEVLRQNQTPKPIGGPRNPAARFL